MQTETLLDYADAMSTAISDFAEGNATLADLKTHAIAFEQARERVQWQERVGGVVDAIKGGMGREVPDGLEWKPLAGLGNLPLGEYEAQGEADAKGRFVITRIRAKPQPAVIVPVEKPKDPGQPQPIPAMWIAAVHDGQAMKMECPEFILYGVCEDRGELGGKWFIPHHRENKPKAPMPVGEPHDGGLMSPRPQRGSFPDREHLQVGPRIAGYDYLRSKPVYEPDHRPPSFICQGGTRRCEDCRCGLPDPNWPGGHYPTNIG